jgi:hypothetical protein
MTSPLEVAIVAGVASLIGGMIVAVTNYLLTEKSKTRDRELPERHKQIDRDLDERARQLDFLQTCIPRKNQSRSRSQQSCVESIHGY